jgi:hypothetical protein
LLASTAHMRHPRATHLLCLPYIQRALEDNAVGTDAMLS